MKLNKIRLARTALALVLSAAVTAITLYLALYLGQAALDWLDAFTPSEQRLFTAGLIILVSLVLVYVGWRYRKAAKKEAK